MAKTIRHWCVEVSKLPLLKQTRSRADLVAIAEIGAAYGTGAWKIMDDRAVAGLEPEGTCSRSGESGP